MNMDLKNCGTRIIFFFCFVRDGVPSVTRIYIFLKIGFIFEICREKRLGLCSSKRRGFGFHLRQCFRGWGQFFLGGELGPRGGVQLFNEVSSSSWEGGEGTQSPSSFNKTKIKKKMIRVPHFFKSIFICVAWGPGLYVVSGRLSVLGGRPSPQDEKRAMWRVVSVCPWLFREQVGRPSRPWTENCTAGLAFSPLRLCSINPNFIFAHCVSSDC